MAMAQVVQAVATWYLLGWLLEKLGFKWTTPPRGRLLVAHVRDLRGRPTAAG